MNTNTNNHKTSYSITRGLFFLIMCSVIFTVLYYSLPRQNREPAISDYIDFSEGWTTSDGSPVDFSHISGTCTVIMKYAILHAFRMSKHLFIIFHKYLARTASQCPEFQGFPLSKYLLH